MCAAVSGEQRYLRWLWHNDLVQVPAGKRHGAHSFIHVSPERGGAGLKRNTSHFDNRIILRPGSVKFFIAPCNCAVDIEECKMLNI